MTLTKNLDSSLYENFNLRSGTVKFINRRRGFGFIQSQDTSKDVFVHVSDLKDRVGKGDKVQFKLIFSDKGLQAKQVRLQVAG